jgi:hypothetical protein
MRDLRSLRVRDQLCASKFKTKKKKRLVTNPSALLASHRLLSKEDSAYLQLCSGGDSRGRLTKERSPLELSIFPADVNLRSGARPRASGRNAQTKYRGDVQPLPYPKFKYTAQSIMSPFERDEFGSSRCHESFARWTRASPLGLNITTAKLYMILTMTPYSTDWSEG